ncbi:uncharacterized protein LOC102713968 [Oryza brachyantha]|uniref:Uncharacterized protein n=1 Tax=Oryza brachyantha TaxID=4533 RepID=J3KVM0_ORYBR|nr:uncharacterized protein LOC102713968 [Oryza brachyantha]
MALLCFLLDLRNIPPPLLRLLNQCLLHLANLYAASSSSSSPHHLPDRLALSYIQPPAAASSPPQLKVVYRPGEKFNLRDFHHAVNSLPLDAFRPNKHGSLYTTGDVSLTNLFSNRAIYSWATDDTSKKVIALCMSAQNTEALRRSLMDAAEQCITVEFVMLETGAIFIYDGVSENSNGFIDRICDLENCVVRRYSPETQVLHGLVKRWLEELKDDKEERLQADFLFRVPIISTVNQISCSIYASANQIIDGFPSCQICRCHGRPIDLVNTDKAKWMCPMTNRQLTASDVTDTAVKIGEHTVLFLPDSEGSSNLRRPSSSISFDVIERTNLASLNEGLIMGTPHIVIPSSNDVEVTPDECSDQNTQLFYGLCETLFKLDQGLVCSSECNTETMKIGSLQCYYLLQPSDKGPMLLRRLAGSEEISPLPVVSQPCNFTGTKEVKNFIEASLSKIVLKDYNPLQHERGFHSRLNCLVKDSLKFGSIPPACGVKDIHHLYTFSEPQVSTFRGPEENKVLSPCREEAGDLHSFSEPPAASSRGPKEKASPSITEEWEQLIVIDDDFTSVVTSRVAAAAKPKSSKLPSPVKPLDEKTNRILERLEAPRAKKQRASTSTGNGNGSSNRTPPVSSLGAGTQIKKPLLPFEPSASQPLRPTFNRLRRKPTAAT